ncbi:hypothetical protein ACLB2K_000238 [Fragaria x ananassa]
MDLQADHKRKRKKEKKRQRTAAVDEMFQFQSKDVASGGHPRKEKRRRHDLGNRESSRKRKVDLIKDDNIFDRSTEASVDDEARKIHAMQGLMSVVDGESKPEDLISLTDAIEYFNKIYYKIVELKQKISSLKKRRKARRRKANWSELANELLQSILKKLIPCEFDIAGFRHIREFKAVCQSWRAAAKACSSYVPLPRTPCLLLHGITQNSFLFDPIGKKKHLIRNVHDYFPNAECVGSSYGWIVMFYEDNELKEFKSKAHLFNPITRGRISIPGDQNLPNCSPVKAIISSNPSFNKNFVVVVQFGERLAYYKHGDEDKSWKMLKVDVKDGVVTGADYYCDQGFVFHNDLLVASALTVTNVWDFKEYPPLRHSVEKSSSDEKYFTYLMESSLTGDILRLIKEGENKTLKFGVEKLDLRERCEENSIYFAARELDKYATLEKYARYDLEKGKVVNESLNPVWNQTFDFVVEDGLHDMLILEVYDHDTFG